MLVNPEGIMNTYIVASQYTVGRNPYVVPFPPNQHFSSSAQVYKHHYPHLSSMPCSMFKVWQDISCTSVSMLLKGAINQSLSNTRRVHVEKDIFTVIEKGIEELTKYLHVKVATTDVHVTVASVNLMFSQILMFKLRPPNYVISTKGARTESYFTQANK
jgi:hypothetical protein